jgi:hypothetical protein
MVPSERRPASRELSRLNSCSMTSALLGRAVEMARPVDMSHSDTLACTTARRFPPGLRIIF